MLRQGKADIAKRSKPTPAPPAQGVNLHSNQRVTRPTMVRWVAPVGGIILILAFLAQGLGFFVSNSQTSDEAVHLAAGYSYLVRDDFRLNPEHPPLIKELCALSVLLAYRLPFQPEERFWKVREQWRIGRDFLYSSPQPWEKILFAARLPNLLLGAALV